jgi:hypothetical protein
VEIPRGVFGLFVRVSTNNNMSQPLTWSKQWRWNAPGLTWNGTAPDSNKSMPSDNRISASIAAADKTAVLDAIQTIRTKLPFLVNLTPDERKQLPKVGDKTLAFDQKCAGYMSAHPELVPGFVSTEELAKDRTLAMDLADIARELDQAAEGVNDTIMLALSEAYMADLSFYQNVRQAAQRGVVGIDTIYSDLNQRFPGRPTNASKTAAAAKAAAPK